MIFIETTLERITMTIKDDNDILTQILDALDNTMEEFGKREIMDILHQYFHNGQPE